ncbi:sugar transferase [Microbacterium sp. LRZ72]|uniref:sugar transferase n=1 Tax=Microbacterium sp. LRZ72 TaxID=2942481 RepID=UPI0029A29E4A|nr:sugar transferase [Microbacterium sp. LRZ72]MDX2377630.1 sugar transferase [Microbacterium sp. LRZ72]
MRFVRLLGFDFAKRLFDVFASAAALVALTPVILFVAALVAINLGCPVIFRQGRPGLRGRVFTLYKFRSMRNPDAAKGLVSDEQRLTRFGRMLRSTSLDELPTLWNVLKGDMSLVGPRPLLVEYLERYSPEQARRHEVRPGVTGLAQVSGRNSLSWEEKFRIDVEYVDARNATLDTQILWRTARAVVLRRGISHDGHATMAKFGASNG